MATRSNRGGLAYAVKVDLVRLHEIWMDFVFPRQRSAHSVMGKWRPQTLPQSIAYNAWGVVGMVLLAILYPLAVVGLATRFYAGKLDSTATRLGFVGVVALSVVVWGALSVVAHFQFSYEGFIAVVMASIVATVSATLAVLFSKVGGRIVSILFAYPFAVTAVFLPPVVAAFYSPMLADTIFTGSEEIAIWLLDSVLFVGGVNDFIRDAFDLQGIAYALMWFGFSFPVGWLLGLLVGLANLVRPTRDRGSADAS